MRRWPGRYAALLLMVLVGVTACASAPGSACRNTGDPAELGRLAATADSTVTMLRTAHDSQATWLRQYLQALVDRTAVLDDCGRLAGNAELRTAAKLGIGAAPLGAPTLERTYQWARRAALADTSDRDSWRIMASAWDQLQVTKKLPQWFATVITCSTTADGRCALAPLDTTKVSDPQRVELGLRTLTQQRATLDSMNRARGRP